MNASGVVMLIYRIDQEAVIQNFCERVSHQEGLTFHRTESQNVWGWKGPLWVI